MRLLTIGGKIEYTEMYSDNNSEIDWKINTQTESLRFRIGVQTSEDAGLNSGKRSRTCVCVFALSILLRAFLSK